MLPATRQRWEFRLYPQPKQVLDLATPEGCKAELTYEADLTYNKMMCVCDVRWMDGFSTFFVGEDGLVYKHKMDRVSQSMIDLNNP